MISGILLVDKPHGPTSHDVVAAVRRIAGQRRVGHAGTLDPAATGLLVVLLGTTTRLADAFSQADKAYEVAVQLGIATETGDSTGAVTARAEVPPLSRSEVERAVAGLEGERKHVVPAYSAVKVRGRPLHRIARSGAQVVERPERIVTVRRAGLEGLAGDRIELSLEVSKGTYVRVLAEELGAALGALAHVSSLRRTRAGEFSVADAITLNDLDAGGREMLVKRLVDVAASRLGVPRARVSDATLADIGFGRPIAAAKLDWIDEPGDRVVILSGSSIAAFYEREGSEYRPRAVLTSASQVAV